MACPSPAFRQDRVEVLRAAIRDLAFKMLAAPTIDGFATSYLPSAVDAGRGSSGSLVGHLARDNPQWQVPATRTQALVVFQAPHGYVSSSWYPSKRDDPCQVPTWDYLIIEARGVLAAFDDDARVLDLLKHLTECNEAGREQRWHVRDAPAEYVRDPIRHTVGIELHVESLVGRYKLSQNRNHADQERVRAALAGSAGQRERQQSGAIALARCERRK